MMGRHRGRSNPVSMHGPFFLTKFPLRQPKRWFVQWGRFRCMHWLRDLQVLEEVQVPSSTSGSASGSTSGGGPSGLAANARYLPDVPTYAWRCLVFSPHPLPRCHLRFQLCQASIARYPRIDSAPENKLGHLGGATALKVESSSLPQDSGVRCGVPSRDIHT